MNTIQSSNHSYNKPVFKGTVSPEVVNVVRQGIKNSIKTEMFQADIFGQKVKPEVLKPLRELKTSTLKGLKDYMAKLHPDTSLTTDGKKFFFENTKLNTKIDLAGGNPWGNIEISGNKSLNINDPAKRIIKDCETKMFSTQEINEHNIQDIKGLASTLERSVDPKALDKAMFYQYTDRIAENANDANSFGLKKLYIQSERANNLAPEFGEKNDILNTFSRMLNPKK